MSAENYLIQSLMWRQCITEDTFKRMVTKCLVRDEPEMGSEMSAEKLSQFVGRVNRQLRPYNMCVSRGPNESDGSIHYALINAADNELTRMTNTWTQKELLYFRKVLAAIIDSNQSAISSTKLLNIGRDEELKLSISAADVITNKWLDHKWLEEVADGKVAVGVRTLLELNVYIRDHFEVHDCFRCKILCIRGISCVTCDTKLHYHCSDSQFIPNNKCPNCGQQFADTTTQTNDSGSTVQSTAQSAAELVVNESNDSTDEDSDPQTHRQSSPRKSNRTKRSRLS